MVGKTAIIVSLVIVISAGGVWFVFGNRSKVSLANQPLNNSSVNQSLVNVAITNQANNENSNTDYILSTTDLNTNTGALNRSLGDDTGLPGWVSAWIAQQPASTSGGNPPAKVSRCIDDGQIYYELDPGGYDTAAAWRNFNGDFVCNTKVGVGSTGTATNSCPTALINRADCQVIWQSAIE